MSQVRLLAQAHWSSGVLHDAHCLNKAQAEARVSSGIEYKGWLVHGAFHAMARTRVILEGERGLV